MAFLELYGSSAGDNLADGTTEADAGVAYDQNGTWASPVWTTGGTAPNASISVGDWVIIYVNGNTTPGAVAKVTAVDATTCTLDTSTAGNYFGTFPTSNNNRRVRKHNGPTTVAAVAGFAGTAQMPIRWNWKSGSGGSYVHGTSGRAFAFGGSTTAPVHHRGYNTAIGDCSSDPTLSRPTWSWSGNTASGLSVSGSHVTVECVNLTGSATNTSYSSFSSTGFVLRVRRCQILYTGTTTGGPKPVSVVSNGSVTFEECYIEQSASANVTAVAAQRQTVLSGCVIRQQCAAPALQLGGNTTNYALRDSIVIGGTNAVSVPLVYATVEIAGNTFYNTSSDGVAFPFVGNPATVENNFFANIGGYCINNTSGTNTNVIARFRNTYYSASSGTESGLGDSVGYDWTQALSAPFVNAGTNCALAAGVTGRAAAFTFEGLTGTTSYTDRGAVQHQDSGGEAGSIMFTL